LDWIGSGQDFQATLWIGLDWVNKNGPMSNTTATEPDVTDLRPALAVAAADGVMRSVN